MNLHIQRSQQINNQKEQSSINSIHRKAKLDKPSQIKGMETGTQKHTRHLPCWHTNSQTS
jgi:hypothetical protein